MCRKSIYYIWFCQSSLKLVRWDTDVMSLTLNFPVTKARKLPLGCNLCLTLQGEHAVRLKTDGRSHLSLHSSNIVPLYKSRVIINNHFNFLQTCSHISYGRRGRRGQGHAVMAVVTVNSCWVDKANVLAPSSLLTHPLETDSSYTTLFGVLWGICPLGFDMTLEGNIWLFSCEMLCCVYHLINNSENNVRSETEAEKWRALNHVLQISGRSIFSRLNIFCLITWNTFSIIDGSRLQEGYVLDGSICCTKIFQNQPW